MACISALAPEAGAWADSQSLDSLSVAGLSELGKSALDAIHREQVPAVTSLILKAVVSHAPNSKAALLARAGLALCQYPLEFSLIRNLYRTFVAIGQVPERQPSAVVLARLGNQLSARDGRRFLAFMAGQGCLSTSVRQLAQAASHEDGPHPKLVFQALLGRLPETVSCGCSAELRHDLLEVRLMTQERPRPTLWQRLLLVLRGTLAA